MSAAGNETQTKGLAPILLGLAIWLFFPLGLFLLWRHPTLGKNGKWWAAGIAWACFLVFMGSRAEKEETLDPAKAEASFAEAGASTLKASKKTNRKPPQIKIELANKSPEVQQAYRDGFDAGIALAYELLDNIEAKAGNMDAKKYINANPLVSADLEERRTTMWRQTEESAGRIGKALADLAERGIRKNMNQHPVVLEVKKAHEFALGKSHAFDEIIDPLLKDE